MDAPIIEVPGIEAGADQAAGRAEDVSPVSLEAAELELALQLQNIVETGFDSAVRHALATLDGTLLFDMPGSLLPGYQRVAAASTGQGEERRIFLIHLAEDGGTIHVEEAAGDTTPLAGFAASYVNLMDRLAA